MSRDETMCGLASFNKQSVIQACISQHSRSVIVTNVNVSLSGATAGLHIAARI